MGNCCMGVNTVAVVVAVLAVLLGGASFTKPGAFIMGAIVRALKYYCTPTKAEPANMISQTIKSAKKATSIHDFRAVDIDGKEVVLGDLCRGQLALVVNVASF